MDEVTKLALQLLRLCQNNAPKEEINALILELGKLLEVDQ